MARALMWREVWWVEPAERGGTRMEQRVPEAQEWDMAGSVGLPGGQSSITSKM